MAADTAAILLFFSGMIAFLPNAQNPLMVDAHLIEVDHHHQYLFLRVDNLKYEEQCQTPCNIYEEEGLCVCDLDGVDVYTSTTAGESNLPTRPPGRLPDQEDVYDIGWLTSMWRVKHEAARVQQGKLLENTSAKVSFGWSQAATCRFEEAYCNHRRRIYAVDFNTAFFADRFAVAELVSFKSSAPAPIVLKLRKRETQNRESTGVPVDLVLEDCLQNTPCPILIANVGPPSKGDVDLCLEEDCNMRDRGHFREYRRVAQNEFRIDPIRRCSTEGRDYVEITSVPPSPLCEPLKQMTFPPQQDPPGKSSLHRASKSINIGLLLRQIVTVGDRIICPSVVVQR